MKLNILFAICLALLLSNFELYAQEYNENWPNWRGPNVDGVSPAGTPPTEWSETKNIKWKTAIPGKGIGTPIIWGDQIFVTSAIELDKEAAKEAIKEQKGATPALAKVMGMSETTENFIQFVVYSINRKNGEIVWQKVVREQYPHEGINENGSWASASCVTDGNLVIASFGSYGIYCFDLQGNMIWEKDLGDMHIELTFGEGISPVLYKEKLIILWDHQVQSTIYVLNKKTGVEIWKKDREEGTTWVTPTVIEINEKAQIVVPGVKKSIGYDIDNGDEVWEITGLGDGIIPCPVFDGERVFLMTGFGKIKIVQAINLVNAKGNLDSTEALVWTSLKNSSYVPSPLLKDGKLYFLKSSRAQLSCYDAKSGKVFYEALKPEGMAGEYASPVAANGNIYILDRKGNCAVIQEGEEFKVIVQNQLDDNFDASPAVAGKDLFLRGYKSLYCISEK